MEHTLLLVDDEQAVLDRLENVLSESYRIIKATSSAQALQMLEKETPDLIIMDVLVSEADNFKVLSELKDEKDYSAVPIIFMSEDVDEEAEVSALESGAVDFVRKSLGRLAFKARIDRAISFYYKLKGFAEKAEERRIDMEQMTINMGYTLAAAIDSRDMYNKNHSEHIADYSVLIGRKLGYCKEELSKLKYAAMLHNIGMISVPDAFINKRGPLDEFEKASMREHTTYGAKILHNVSMVDGIDKVAHFHHERFDGSGYPTGISGEEIPLMARIVGLADAYDSMKADRPYRAAMTDEQIIDELNAQKGKQFDPELVDIVLELINENAMVTSDEEEIDISDIIGEEGLIIPELDELDEEDLKEVKKPLSNVDDVMKDMEETGTYFGAMDLSYKDFARHFKYLSNVDDRFGHNTELVLITISAKEGCELDFDIIDGVMDYMEEIIKRQIRNVDVVNRYSPLQFLVLLMGTEKANVSIAMGRIFDEFKRSKYGEVLEPEFSLCKE